MPPVRDVVVCPVCGHLDTSLAPGPGGRPSAACRGCGSLERHRALSGLLPALAAHAGRGIVLDIAPTPLVSGYLRDIADGQGAVYVGMDFDPAADGREVGLRASMTDLPLRDRSVGLSVCFHVLEHVPDDAAAMREMARTVADGGLYLVQVPRRPGPTDEDPDASVEERIRRFGQADHVRYYGDDFEDRLRAAGLRVRALTLGELYHRSALDRLGLAGADPLWLCAADETTLDLSGLRAACAAHALDALARASTTAAADRQELRARADAASRSELELRGRLARLRARTRRLESGRATARRELARTRTELRAARAVSRRRSVRVMVRLTDLVGRLRGGRS